MISTASPARTVIALCSSVAPALISPMQRSCAGKVLTVGRPHRKAIARGTRKGREIAVGPQILSQHQTRQLPASDIISGSVGRGLAAYCFDRSGPR